LYDWNPSWNHSCSSPHHVPEPVYLHGTREHPQMVRVRADSNIARSLEIRDVRGRVTKSTSNSWSPLLTDSHMTSFQLPVDSWPQRVSSKPQGMDLSTVDTTYYILHTSAFQYLLNFILPVVSLFTHVFTPIN
jgi:hypothetical protein